MLTILSVGIGTGIGAFIRYIITVKVKVKKDSFLTPVFFSNILASFLLGIIMSLKINNYFHLGNLIYSFLIPGLTAGLSTLSSMIYEGLNFSKKSDSFFYFFYNYIFAMILFKIGFEIIKFFGDSH